MSLTKRVFWVIAVFIPVYILVVIITGKALMEQKYYANLPYQRVAGFMHTRLQEVKDYSQVDILVLGSSHAYKGVDPRIFEQSEIQIFNMGSGIQTPEISYTLLEMYIDSLRPKMVLFSANPEVFDNSMVWSHMDILSNMPPNWKLLKRAVASADIRVINVMIYSAFSYWVGAMKNISEPIKMEDDTYIKAGFVERKYGRYTAPDEYASFAFTLSPKQFRYFCKIKAMLEERNIPLLVFQSPIPEHKRVSCSNFEAFNTWLCQSGCNYLDYNVRLPFPDSMFYDISHLNQDGIRVMNTDIIQKIKQDQLLIQ